MLWTLKRCFRILDRLLELIPLLLIINITTLSDGADFIDFLFGALPRPLDEEGPLDLFRVQARVSDPLSKLPLGQNLMLEGSVPCRILSVRLLRGSASDHAHLLLTRKKKKGGQAFFGCDAKRWAYVRLLQRARLP